MGKRAAVVGLGGMGRRHVAALEKAGFGLRAVCDRNEAAASSLPGVQAYTDWRRLLEVERGAIDLLVVATNGPSHYEIVMAAAGCGIPMLLCEKPLATSAGKARAMAAECDRRGVRLGVNLSRRFDRGHRLLKAALQEGLIGQVRHFTIAVGAGGIGCIGTHFFDLVAWLTDTRPRRVSALLDEQIEPNVRGPEFCDPGGRGMVLYEGGISAFFQLMGDIPILPMVTIQGTEGYVDLSWQPGNEVRAFARPADKRAEPRTRLVPPVAIDLGPIPPMDIVAATSACILDLAGPHAEPTAQAGVDAVEVVMGFHASARGGMSPVELPLTGGATEIEVAIT